MKLIFKSLFRYKWLLLFNFISAFGFALAELGIPTIFGTMVDAGIEAGNTAALYNGFYKILFVAFTGTAGTLCLAYTSNRLSTNIVYDLRRQVFDKAMELSHADLEKLTVSSLITRTGSDPYQIMMFVNSLLRSAMVSPIMLVVCLILAMRTSLDLSLILLVTIPIIVAGVIIVFRISGPLSRRQQSLLDSMNQVLRENMSGIRVIRSFGREQLEEKRFDDVNEQYLNTSSKLFKLMNLTDPMFFFVMNMAVICIYYLASILLSENQMQIGQLLMFVEYLFHCMMSVLVFAMIFVMVPRASVSARRIEEVLNMEPSIQNKPDAKKAQRVTSLEFDHVSFQYPDGEEHCLKDISFSAKTGDKVAVIGPTGSGKSSVARLLSRFYDVSNGSVKINGEDIRNYDLESLRSQIGSISQKPHLFSGTIESNLRFGKEEASQDEMEQAAAMACAKEFIDARALNYADPVSEEGTNLSGGQKQRLSIARALMARPGLYIFDDSFSALDFATDARLRKNLEELRQDSIFLIVAQRVSTIMDSDQILVLDHGSIVGKGTHQELMKSCELYREIVLSQMSEEEALRNG